MLKRQRPDTAISSLSHSNGEESDDVRTNFAIFRRLRLPSYTKIDSLARLVNDIAFSNDYSCKHGRKINDKSAESKG